MLHNILRYKLNNIMLFGFIIGFLFTIFLFNNSYVCDVISEYINFYIIEPLYFYSCKYDFKS